uniref:G-protein coupled receptors family 1 profile domain-containing protein n=1 Tax=Cavia porcellus TaxID=10141 RepID=A0A286XR23_CAVPO
MKNHTAPLEFILLGLSGDPELQIMIFLFLIITYILNIAGNVTIITLTLVDSHLETPIIPRILSTIVTRDKIISYSSCTARLFFFISLGIPEFYLLTAMSYDRYVAICKPLHYTTIINKKVCILLVFCAWLAGFLSMSPPVILFLHLDYCGSNVIDHFACDYFPLLQLSLIGFYSAIVILLFTLSKKKGIFYMLLSHDCHFYFIWKLKSIFTKGLAIFNTSAAPMMNPFIYTLRNQQVKQALTHKKVTLFFGK